MIKKIALFLFTVLSSPPPTTPTPRQQPSPYKEREATVWLACYQAITAAADWPPLNPLVQPLLEVLHSEDSFRLQFLRHFSAV